MAAHSRFGGSSASRWMNCAGSVALLETVPAKPSSKYADEGSAAHALAAACLAEDLHPAHFLGSPMEGWPDWIVTQEMCDAVVTYLNVVTREVAQTRTAQLYVEQGFTLDIDSAEPGEVFGTNDAMVYHPETGRLVVFDYKHGQGVSVSAEDNAQLKFYAAGAAFANEWKLSEVILRIVQPRARDADEIGAVREWPMDLAELLEFKAEVTDAIEDAKRVQEVCNVDQFVVADFETGSWCRWCDAAAICPAKQAEAVSPFTDVKIEDLTVDALPDPKTLVPERLAEIVKGIDLLQAWSNQCREYLEALLLGGTAVPGWKVVDKIGRAKWVADEEEIAADLGLLYGLDEDLIRPRKLATIGDVEKLLKGAGATKDEIDSFKLANTLKDSSGLTIAPDSDRRPAIDAAARAFGDVQT
jgi:hypothetical protein